MATKNSLNKLKDMLANPESLTMDNMEELVGASMELFREYAEISKSKDPEEKKKALDGLLEFQESLNETLNASLEKAGVTQDQLMEIMSNPTNFSSEGKKEMEHVNNMLKDLNTEIIREASPRVKKQTETKTAHRRLRSTKLSV